MPISLDSLVLNPFVPSHALWIDRIELRRKDGRKSSSSLLWRRDASGERNQSRNRKKNEKSCDGNLSFVDISLCAVFWLLISYAKMDSMPTSVYSFLLAFWAPVSGRQFDELRQQRHSRADTHMHANQNKMGWIFWKYKIYKYKTRRHRGKHKRIRTEETALKNNKARNSISLKHSPPPNPLPIIQHWLIVYVGTFEYTITEKYDNWKMLILYLRNPFTPASFNHADMCYVRPTPHPLFRLVHRQDMMSSDCESL